ncbi:MAG: prepilin-type N-terminal cleavage/methylation domain-containing protein [Planctomycetota bacterium]
MVASRVATRFSAAPRRLGLTLFELVVVLAILAAMAAAASVATDRYILQRRAEITNSTLDSFRRSVLGNFGAGEQIRTVTSHESPTQISGFIADVGRLPAAFGSDAATQLSELWSNPNGISGYGLKTAPGDPDVTLSCGWRGPYLDLPLGTASLHDGFGRPLSVLTVNAGSPVIAGDGDPIWGLTSFGSDGAVGHGTTDLPLDTDTTVWLGDSLSAWQADLNVRVFELDGSGGKLAPSQAGSLIVRLYRPDPATGDIVFSQSGMLSTPAPVNVAFPETLVGPKVLRAYWVSGDASQSVQSAVSPIEVRRGGATEFELLLPTLPTPSP